MKCLLSTSYRRMFVVTVGIVLMATGLWLSTLGTNATVMTNSIQAVMPEKLDSSFAVPMMLGDRLIVLVEPPSLQATFSIFFLDHLIVQSPAFSTGLWTWIANGNANYTLRATSTVAGGPFTFTFSTVRLIPAFPLATPLGLGVGMILISAISFRPKITWSSVRLPKRPHLTKGIVRLAIIVVLAFLVRVYPLPSLIHNDELGMNLSGNWGYFASGYVDTVGQIVAISRESPLSYQAWANVLNQGKPLVGVFLMSVPSLITGNSNFLFLSRLVVEVCGAISVALMFLVVQKLFGLRAGILAGGLTMLDPLMLNYSRAAYPDAISLLFQLLTLIFLLRFRETGEARIGILSGIMLGLAGASKSLLMIGALAPVILLTLNLHKKFSWRAISHGLTMICIAIVVFWISWPRLWTLSVSTIDLAGVHLSVSPALGARFPEIQDTMLYLGTIQTLPIYYRPILDLLLNSTYFEVAGFIVGLAMLLRRSQPSTENLGRIVLSAWFGIMLLGAELFYVNQHDLLYLLTPFIAVSSVGLSHLVTWGERHLNISGREGVEAV